MSTLSFSDQVKIINNYQDMTVFEMSTVFDIDDFAIGIFLHKQGLKAKPDPLNKKVRIAKRRIYKEDIENKVFKRPPPLYSNKSHAYLVDYYTNLK